MRKQLKQRKQLRTAKTDLFGKNSKRKAIAQFAGNCGEEFKNNPWFEMTYFPETKSYLPTLVQDTYKRNGPENWIKEVRENNIVKYAVENNLIPVIHEENRSYSVFWPELSLDELERNKRLSQD